MVFERKNFFLFFSFFLCFTMDDEKNVSERLYDDAWAIFGKGDYKDSLELCKNELKKKGGKGKMRGLWLNLAANCCIALGDGKAALQYSSEQADLAAREGGKKSRSDAVALGNKVDALNMLGRLKEALKVVDEAIEILRELTDVDDLGLVLAKKAKIFRKQKVSYCCSLEFCFSL